MKTKIWSLLILAVMLLPVMVSCSKDNSGDSPKEPVETKEDENVIINDDGTTSNGSFFSAVDDKNFYLAYIKYSVEVGHLVVSGYDKMGFKGEAKIASSVTYKGITYKVMEIGSNTFYNCTGLTSVTIPNSVKGIGNYAFYGCGGLTSVTIPNSVTNIGDYAFCQCHYLTSITIPNSVTSLGKFAFSACAYLTSVTIPNSVTSIGDYVFCGSGLTSVIIPNSVMSIGRQAFSACAYLTSVTIPNSVMNIGDYAFSGCYRLTSVTIPNSITSIGEGVFYKCIGLTSVTIPNSVTSIEAYAFQECSALKDVFCYTRNVCKAQISSFDTNYIKNITLHVPAASIDAYKASSPWSNFKDIVALTESDPKP